MKDIDKKALGGLFKILVILALVLFISAGNINYWQAWAFLIVFFISTLLITLYLMKNDPKLLERRVNGGPAAEQEGSQKVIQTLASLAFIAVLVSPSLDHRFGWSSVPAYISIAGEILIALGFYFVFLVFKENTYTSAIIEVSEGQTLISTGPYALVRHPMYSGALILLLGVPLALGSYWGLLTIVPFTFVLALRLLDEEKFLLKNLAGYAEYKQKVKYRLAPFIW